MESTVNERIKIFIDSCYKGNVASFCRVIDVSRTTLGSIIGKDGALPGYDILRKIGEITDPKVSLEWLILGEGDMLSESKERPENGIFQRGSGNIAGVGGDLNQNGGEIISALTAQLAEKDRQIDRLFTIVEACEKYF